MNVRLHTPADMPTKPSSADDVAPPPHVPELPPSQRPVTKPTGNIAQPGSMIPPVHPFGG